MKHCLVKSFNFAGTAADLLGVFKDRPYVFCLDSSQFHLPKGRYSFIGFDPFDTVKGRGSEMLSVLRQKYRLYKTEEKGIVPLPSGVVGFLGYDYGLYQERIPLQSEDDLRLTHCLFGFYDCILTVDHVDRKLYITSSGLPERTASLRQARAAWRLEQIEKEIRVRQKELFSKFSPGHLSLPDKCDFDRIPRGSAAGIHIAGMKPFPDTPAQGVGELRRLHFSSNFPKEQYLGAVRKALQHIEAGDIYQVNLSQRFAYDVPFHDFSLPGLFRSLRHLSPVSFGGYFDAGDFQIISNSPEQFLRLRDGVVQARPMKGTRPRGRDADEDKRMREEIDASAKDRAELLMITDLGRNDLGKVCRYGSVRVKKMRTIEEYNYVFQATSLIEGVLREDKDCFDLIAASFPGGSITGCPKIRSMQIIEELEPTRRGIYTGSLGYISFSGNMDFNILIRTILNYRRKLYFQVGGGIVADSTPEGEYEETLVKARAMRACLESVFSQPQGQTAGR